MSNKTKLDSGRTVDSWYDRHTRSWVTQLLDENDCQLGDAEYSGTREGMRLDRMLIIEEDHRLGPIEPKQPTTRRLKLSGEMRVIELDENGVAIEDLEQPQD